jgi:hypothetical protein
VGKISRLKKWTIDVGTVVQKYITIPESYVFTRYEAYKYRTLT